MKVYWTENAENNLDAIYSYIAQRSATYALRMVDRITRRSIQISSFPLSGRMVPEYDSNEIREVIEWPYRIIYSIKQDQIDVMAVIHGARNIMGDE